MRTMWAMRCVYPSNCSLKSWQSNKEQLDLVKSLVVYILQIVHWNPDKATLKVPVSNMAMLCISFKLFIEILTKQLFYIEIICEVGCVYPSNCSLKSWQSNLSFDSLQIVFVVYILQIVHWNPDKATMSQTATSASVLCISFKLFIEILTKQHEAWCIPPVHGCVYPSNCSLKSWQSNLFTPFNLVKFVVYILQIVHWNPDKATTDQSWYCFIQLCISFKLFIEILTKQLPVWMCLTASCCVYPSNCSLKSWQSNTIFVLPGFSWLCISFKLFIEILTKQLTLCF